MNQFVYMNQSGLKLNPKQKRFCEEYIIDLNGAQAAIRAGYSKKTAKTIANQLLTKLDLQSYVAELMAKRSKKTEITAENVLQGIAGIAFSEKVKVGDNLKGLEMLGRHLILFTDKTEHSTGDKPLRIIWEDVNAKS